MKATFMPCDKSYRDHILKADGFYDTLEYNWRKAKLTQKQIITISKLSGGYWEIVIDDAGHPSLVMHERMFVRDTDGHKGQITFSFSRKDADAGVVSTESQCISEFGEEKWFKILERMEEAGWTDYEG